MYSLGKSGFTLRISNVVISVITRVFILSTCFCPPKIKKNKKSADYEATLQHKQDKNKIQRQLISDYILFTMYIYISAVKSIIRD